MPCLSSASDASTPRSCKRVKKKSLEAGADTLPVAQPCVVYVKALKGFSTFHYRWAYASHADEGMQSGQRCPFKHITETHISSWLQINLKKNKYDTGSNGQFPGQPV